MTNNVSKTGWVLVAKPADVAVVKDGVQIGTASAADFIFKFKKGSKVLHPNVIAKIPKRCRANREKTIEFIKTRELAGTTGPELKGSCYGVPVGWISNSVTNVDTTAEKVKELAEREEPKVEVFGSVDCKYCGAPQNIMVDHGLLPPSPGSMPEVIKGFNTVGLHDYTCPVRSTRLYRTVEELEAAYE